MTSPPAFPVPLSPSELHGAMSELHGHCDGAQTLDGMGFSKNHASIGAYLAQTPPERWGASDVEVAWYLCCFHRKQLSHYGVPIPEAPLRDEASWKRTLSRARKHAGRDVQAELLEGLSGPQLRFTDARGKSRTAPLESVTWADVAALERAFDQPEFQARREALSAVGLLLRERSRANLQHRCPQSVMLTARPALLWRLPAAAGQRLAALPGAHVKAAQGHYEFSPLHLPELLGTLAELGLPLATRGEDLAELTRACRAISERYAGPFTPGVPNLYCQAPLHGSAGERVLALYGPYDAGRLAAVRVLPGRDWTGEADEFPLSSFSTLEEGLRGFGVVSQLTPEDLALLQAAVQAPDADPVQVYETLVGQARRVIFEFPYDPERADRIKSDCDVVFRRPPEAPRAGWYADPSHLPQIVRAAEHAGLRVSDELLSRHAAVQDAARQDAAYAQAALDLRRASVAGADAPLPPLPGLTANLMPHQTLPVHLWPMTRTLLLADEQGLGKSVEAIAVMLSVRARSGALRAVVVCPSNLTANWVSEFAEHAPGALKVAVLETTTPGPIPPEVEVAVIGWAVLADWQDMLSAWQPQLLIADEGQMAKGGGGPWGTQRGEAAQQLAATVRTLNAGGGVLVMTGTPIDTRPLDALALFQLLGKEETFGGVWKFKQRYCGPKSVRVKGGRTITTYQGASHTHEFHELLDAHPWYVRRTKRLLVEAGLMGPKIVNGVDWYDLHTPERPRLIALDDLAMSEYMAAVLAFREYLLYLLEESGVPVAALSEEEITALLAKKMRNILPKLTVLREVVGRVKQAAVLARVRELNAQGEQVVVIAHHRKVVDGYARALGGTRALKIQGGMTVQAVEETKRFFNTQGVREAPVLVLSMDAGKLGHTLCLQKKLAGLPECARVVIAEEAYSPGAEAQAMDRLWRIPQTRTVEVENVLAQGTLDEGLYLLRRAKRRAAAVITDGEAVDGDADLTGMLAVWIHGLNFLAAAEHASEQETSPPA